MSVIIRNSTIRPSTRDANSTYRVKVANVSKEVEIILFIDNESKDFRQIYRCTGELFQESDSIHFKVNNHEDKPEIIWTGKQQPELVR